jgi:DeoR/GlpR family transcriptional regulator of sugar metabolism
MPAPVLDKLNERQKTIINFLKERGKAQVSDLQTVLADVTKRTIRRDLDELLKIGKIGRTGDFNEVSYHING